MDVWRCSAPEYQVLIYSGALHLFGFYLDSLLLQSLSVRCTFSRFVPCSDEAHASAAAIILESCLMKTRLNSDVPSNFLRIEDGKKFFSSYFSDSIAPSDPIAI